MKECAQIGDIDKESVYEDIDYVCAWAYKYIPQYLKNNIVRTYLNGYAGRCLAILQ